VTFKIFKGVIRPGRIDYILTLDHNEKEQFVEMITYFKVKIDTKLIDELFSYKPKFTCAYIENLIKEYYVNKTEFISILIDEAKLI